MAPVASIDLGRTKCAVAVPGLFPGEGGVRLGHSPRGGCGSTTLARPVRFAVSRHAGVPGSTGSVKARTRLHRGRGSGAVFHRSYSMIHLNTQC